MQDRDHAQEQRDQQQHRGRLVGKAIVIPISSRATPSASHLIRGLHRGELAEQGPGERGRLVHQQQQHDREEEEQAVDHAREREPVVIGALVGGLKVTRLS